MLLQKFNEFSMTCYPRESQGSIYHWTNSETPIAPYEYGINQKRYRWHFTDKKLYNNKKWQDYVYIQCEYKSTKQKIKHLLREENKVKENKMS